MDNTLNKKKKFQMPHVFAILFMIMILVTVLSYIIPNGAFERIPSETGGQPTVNTDNFQFIKNKDPIGFLDFFSAIYTGFVNAGVIMGSLLICSGGLAILNYTGALEAGIRKLMEVTNGKGIIAILIFYVYFAGMNIMGAGEGAYPFFPIVIGIIISLGYDRIMGMMTICFAATAGFACGMVNLFTTGISQQIVGLPMFSGIGYRAVVFVVMFVIGLISTLLYAKKIKSDPNKSYVADEYKAQLAERAEAKDDEKEQVPFDGKRKLALLIFIAVILFTAYGALKLSFGLGQFAALYVVMALILAVIFRINVNQFCQLFTQGAAQVLGAAFAIALAQSVMVLLNQGQIMDTIVYYMGNGLQGKSAIVTLLLIFLFVTAFNFLVVSGSGKAVIMMPIMSPLGKMLNINQQVMVLTYQLGDGLTNMLWPGGGMVCCALCGVNYGDWLKASWKTFVTMIVSGFVLIVIANAINYGPF